MAVLDPLQAQAHNWDEVIGAADRAVQRAGAPASARTRQRAVQPRPELWIEREDYEETPPKGFFRLFPGNKVRLKYGYVIECIGAEKDAGGQVATVLAKLVPDTKSGTPGADAVKVKGVLTWVGAHEAVPAELRLYDRLFREAQPEGELADALNPDSKKVVAGYVEPSLTQAAPDAKFQFERHGYFVAERDDHRPGRAVFNKITGLKDSWAR
jgi:glutaminyl-tRNA synthetase